MASKFDYQFIDEPEDILKCSICLGVARGQPMQHGASGCGMLFCKECIKKNKKKPCPMCRGKDPKYFKDARSLREIKALRVRCDNGICKWTGTVATLEDHVDNTCGYTIVSCSNKCKYQGIDACMMRMDLEGHLKTECPNRYHTCRYCDKEGTYASITGEHDQECLRKPIPCLNRDCSLTIEMGRVLNHVASECEHTVVSCKYNNIGCTEKRKRKDIKTHEDGNDRVHLHLALHKVAQLSIGWEERKGKKTVLVDIPGYAEKKKNDNIFHSDAFFTVPNGYKMRIYVYCNGCGPGTGTHVSISANLLDIPYKDQLKWPFKGTATFELLNQLADTGHKIIFAEFIDNESARISGLGWGILNFIPHSELAHNAAANTCYLVNDTLHFRVTIEEKNDRPWLH